MIFVKRDWTKGQAITEYLLLLVIVLGILGVFLIRFSKPLSDWIQYMAGAYVECLLDQGVLPALGGDNLVEDCEMPSITIGGGQGSGIDPGSRDNGGPDTQRRSQGSASGRGDNRAYQVGSGSFSPEANRFTSRRFGRQVSPMATGSRTSRLSLNSTAGIDGSVLNPREFSISSANDRLDERPSDSEPKASQLNVGDTPGRRLIRIQRKKRNFIDGKTLSDEKVDKNELGIIKKRQTIKKSADGNDSQEASVAKVRKFSTEAFKPPKNSAYEGNFQISIGRLFRIALILVILVGIAWFFISQFVQIKKNLESSN